MKGNIILTESNGRRAVDIRNRFLAFKNNASFTNCVSKINNVLTDNAKDLDIVMTTYNLLEYSKHYWKTTGSFWNNYRDEPNNPPDDNYNADPITNSESFKYKSSMTGKTSDANWNTERENTKTKKNLKIVVPLKYLSDFWRSLDMPFINCEISLTLTWSTSYVLTDIKTQTARNADPNVDPPIEARERTDAPTNAIFKITDTKLYVPVVTLSTKDDNNFL